jgi:CRP/FNR family transcriptional regulator
VGNNSTELFHLWLENPVFAAAGEAVCGELAAAHAPRSHPPGTVLIRTGEAADHVLVVLSGTVRIYQEAADGREVVVKLLRSPCILGDLELLAELPLLKSVAAVDDVQLAAVPARDFLDLLVEYPAAMMAHLQQVSVAFCVAIRNQRQVFASVEQRVANLLLSYADLYGEQQEGGVVIGRSLSQQEIARSLGTVRRTVAQVLSDWTTKELVSRVGRSLVLRRCDRLEELAAPIRGSLTYQMGMSVDTLLREERPGLAELVIVSGPGSLPGRRYVVERELLIGRERSCQLRLPDELLSVRHCRVFRGATGSRYWLEDLGSDNGTHVNGRSVRRAVLREDDLIRVGSIQLRFQLHRPEVASVT